MNLIAINLLVTFCSIALLVGMVFYFKRKNMLVQSQQEFEDYIRNMAANDKIYTVHARQLNRHLNTINYWLKFGREPEDAEEESERADEEDRFFSGLMTNAEALKWKEKSIKNPVDDTVDTQAMALRIDEFSVTDMEPMEVEQPEMKFFYSTEFGESIYYCATPKPLENCIYKNVIYFTTARPTNIPLVYPHKYEGAQMLSLYRHPAQTVWFLKNWKLIREGLEAMDNSVDLDESVKDFDL